MRIAHGYAMVSGPDVKLKEYDTATCGHCNRIVFTKAGSASTVYLFPQMFGPPKEEAGAMCRVCMRAVCLTWHDDGNCVVLERRLEAMEARGRFLKAVAEG